MLTPVLEKLLMLQDRLNRARYRRNRYGAGLHTAHLVAGAARLRPLRRWTERRIETIDASYIK